MTARPPGKEVTEMNITETKLHPDLIRAAQDAGFEQLTEIQEKCLIPALEGKDIAGISQTGTGKTVAFLLPILNSLFNDDRGVLSALIVTPTRELCVQISEEVEKLTSKTLKVCTIYGGESYARQEEQLKESPQIIVATPGRLIDYLKQKKINLSTLNYLVLDEADRMFDMGFIRDIRYIMKSAPESVRTMLFSATLSYYVMRLASDFMDDPVEVRIESESVAVEKIDQKLFHLGRDEKMAYLINSLLSEEDLRVVVFTNLKNMVPVIVNKLRKYGIHATGLSSMLEQKKRIRLLKEFKLGRYSVLVATDVASRGLDVDDIRHVYNYDLPQDAESYVHRIGRTARAGKSGSSLSFCSEADYEFLPRIERYIGNKIPVEAVNPEYLTMPQGHFTPFVDEHDRMFRPQSPRDRDRGRPSDSRDKRNTERRPRKDKGKDSYRDKKEFRPVKKREKDDASSIRAADRAALLDRMENVRPGTASKIYEESEGYSEAGRKGPRKYENKNRDRGYKGGRPRSGQRDDGRKRTDNRKKGYRSSKPDRSRTPQKQEKKGLVSKILSIFKKN
ncbi:MAG: DEAD/DEAH box helicase [Spirochaetia bacterium]|nr:DEAD/DEAH box helicase [Spirochaetia bacterium]